MRGLRRDVSAWHLLNPITLGVHATAMQKMSQPLALPEGQCFGTENALEGRSSYEAQRKIQTEGWQRDEFLAGWQILNYETQR